MRASPEKRKKLKRVIPTERDIILFEALYRHGVMTRSQIQQYLDWECVSDVNRRLRKLYDAGYVDRRFLPRKSGPTSAVYISGNESLKLLVQHSKFKKGDVNRRRHRFNRLSDNLLPHELLITECACLLKATLRRYSGCGFHKWECDDEIVNRCNIIEGGADVELKPDAYGSYHLHKTLFNFFIEADLGTEPLSRIRKKVELYRSFKASGLFKVNFERQAFRLFIVTNSGVRARNISQSLPQTDDLKTYIANIDAIRIDLLLAPVWLMAGTTRAQSLHLASELNIDVGAR